MLYRLYSVINSSCHSSCLLISGSSMNEYIESVRLALAYWLLETLDLGTFLYAVPPTLADTKIHIPSGRNLALYQLSPFSAVQSKKNPGPIPHVCIKTDVRSLPKRKLPLLP